MVARVSENPVAQEHYTAQVALTAAVTKALARLGRPRPIKQTAALTQEFSRAAIALAADYYDDAREHAKVGGLYRPPVIAPWDTAAIEAYIDTASTDILETLDTGDIESQIDALAAQLALNAGTDELFSAILNDPKGPRYARVTRAEACSFCLLLATRGAVYRTKESGSFRPHLKCRCDVEPVWGMYEPPAHIRAAQSLYSESTAGEADKLNAFRRAVYADRKNVPLDAG